MASGQRVLPIGLERGGGGGIEAEQLLGDQVGEPLVLRHDVL